MTGLTRDEFLARVQRATGGHVMRRTGDAATVEGEPGRMEPVASLSDAFAERASAAGMHVHRVLDVSGVRDVMVRVIREEKATNVLTWPTRAIDDLDLSGLLAAEGVSVERWDSAAPGRKVKAFAMSCGVTEVDYAVAETGSLVLCGSPNHPRSVSLLGRMHVALVREDQIVPDLYDLADRLLADLLGAMPSNVTFITGPSKTADIELQLVIGVHGPETVHVVLVKP